jgi:hypothetical protein
MRLAAVLQGQLANAQRAFFMDGPKIEHRKGSAQKQKKATA